MFDTRAEHRGSCLSLKFRSPISAGAACRDRAYLTEPERRTPFLHKPGAEQALVGDRPHYEIIGDISVRNASLLVENLQCRDHYLGAKLLGIDCHGCSEITSNWLPIEYRLFGILEISPGSRPSSTDSDSPFWANVRVAANRLNAHSIHRLTKSAGFVQTAFEAQRQAAPPERRLWRQKPVSQWTPRWREQDSNPRSLSL